MPFVGQPRPGDAGVVGAAGRSRSCRSRETVQQPRHARGREHQQLGEVDRGAGGCRPPGRGAERLEVVERQPARGQHLGLELAAQNRVRPHQTGKGEELDRRFRWRLNCLCASILDCSRFILYYCLRTQVYTTNQGRAMSTTAEQTDSIPTGTWSLDPVHSSVGFAVNYSGAGTVRGGFNEFDAKLVDGKLEGSAKVASVSFDEREPRRPSPVPRLLRRRAVPRAALRLEDDRAQRRRRHDRRRAHASRRDEARHDHGHGRRPDAGCRDAGPIQRIALGRRDHDRPPRVRHRVEPRRCRAASPRSANDVKITANLALVQAA